MAQANVTKITKPKAARTPVDKNETKAAKFVRLGKKRMTKALGAINGVKQLSGRGYESTDEQVTKIITALETAVAEAKTAYANRGANSPAKAQFDLT